MLKKENDAKESFIKNKLIIFCVTNFNYYYL